MLLASIFLLACGGAEVPASPPVPAPGSFGDDLAFLTAHTEVVVLKSGNAQVAVVPAWQGRVMTSTADGSDGASFGWIHRPVIAAGVRTPHMTVLGGEDRFWLGPEGGQFALYFPPGAPFELAHWQVPELIDWGSWEVRETTPSSVALSAQASLLNRAGIAFDVRVDRTVRLVTDGANQLLGADPGPGVSLVAYESENTLTNTGAAAWAKDTGLLSVWILGMYNPSPTTTIVLPFKPGDEAALGPVVNDAYFGKIPADRLVIGTGVLYFKGDGQQRGKIGIPRPRARDVAGSYDPEQGVLTLVQYTLPEGATDYVNSMWEIQTAPYGGDVVNSYNDGPPSPGAKPLGPFYELETSSPAAALEPGQSLTHIHRTFHLQGPPEGLDPVARALLGVSVAEIGAAFPVVGSAPTPTSEKTQ